MRMFYARAFALLLALGVSVASSSRADSHGDAESASAAYRCSKLADLIACGEALNTKPNDPQLLLAEADALMQLKRPGEAIGVYRNAVRDGANARTTESRIMLAQSLRRSLLNFCMTGQAQAAEAACEAAWLPGAPDEVALFKRRGLLLRGHQLVAALDAYMAAARLSPRDRGAARGVIDAAAAAGRKDVATLTAVGSAFLALGHASEAIVPLEEAVRLAPNSTVAEEHLHSAERALGHASSAGASAQDIPSGSGDSSGNAYSNESEPTRSN